MATDIEMTKLCAEAMGLKQWELRGIPQQASESSIYIVDEHKESGYAHYGPLHNDTQVMALVRRFHLDLTWDDETGLWDVCPPKGAVRPLITDFDLNRAIVECVSKMRATGSSQDTPSR